MAALRTAGAGGPHLVLICAACRYAWEPLSGTWTAEDRQAFAAGCPECGDWLFLGELADPGPATAREATR